ncbi:MAG TPA: hypothetical protein VHN99_03820 [Deinococcales bacterium]|nr:hypothetical protein [Deinococcales bacterium]
MKRAWFAVLLLPALAACNVNIDLRGFGPVTVSDQGAPSLVISRLYYDTDQQDADGNPVVCNDRSTVVSYGFKVTRLGTATLNNWDEYFLGREDGGSISHPGITYTTTGVTQQSDNMVLVQQTIAPGAAIFAAPAPGVKAQSIVVDPPAADKTGRMNLTLTFHSSLGGVNTYTFPSIRVLDNCGS